MSNTDTINWEDLYVQLFAYTDNLLKTHKWFRKGKTDSFLKGKQVHDYVSEAIEKFLRHPKKYDPSKRSLAGYLKEHIIRTLVGNDSTCPENLTTTDLFVHNNDIEGDFYFSIESILPFANALFDQEIDFKQVMTDIKTEIIEDGIAEKIFEGIRCNGLKRRDVIDMHEMTAKDFDNGMKRLTTILNQIGKKYNLIQPK